jgi:hypothetical protein
VLPTRGYRVLCHDPTLIDPEAEGMWPMGRQLEFTVTTLVIGLPRLYKTGSRDPVLLALLANRLGLKPADPSD